MDTKDLQEQQEQQGKKVWISITGYRTLVILKSLLEGGKTVKDLINVLESQPYLNKSISVDTVRVALNTLKAAGCKFTRPSKANDYRYEIISHPFHFNMTDEESEAFIALREKLAEDFSLQEVVLLNSIYDKISKLIFNQQQFDNIINSKPLIYVKENVLAELSNPDIFGKKISITYSSPKYGEENLDIIPKKLSYENSKLYLFCYNFKYNKASLLNVERILAVNKIDISQTFDTENTYFVTYKLTGSAFELYHQADYEEIVGKNNNSITVKAKVENEFIFIQRILMFGADFKIISPDFFKNKLIDKLKLIRKRYEEV